MILESKAIGLKGSVKAPCSRSPRLSLLLCCLLCALSPDRAAFADALLAPAGPDPGAKRLAVGYQSSLFTAIAQEDAKAATKVWAERMGAINGMRRFKPEVTIYKSMRDVAADLSVGRLDIFVITSAEYLQWRGKMDAEPWCQSDPFSFALIARKEDAISGLLGLKGKKLLIASNDRGLIPETWLDVSLLEKGLPEACSFFGSAKEAAKPEGAVLPVFFKQADACVVRKASYGLLCEMNPQLSQKLQIVAESPAYLSALVCMRKGYDPGEKAILTRNYLNMSDTTEGRQIIDLFRAGRPLVFDPKMMAPVAGLFADYERLSGHPVRLQEETGEEPAK